ncbi:MAG: phosphate ABC transporter permease PstA [bacterium]|nr:phosphate ABC transporter permease PstA [bacterium]
MVKKYKTQTGKGETWVWFTAMGLTVGILMVSGILGLILVRGLEVFWPKQVVQIQYGNADSSQTLAGELVLRRKSKNSQTGEIREEIQVFQGNRDVLGQAFRYLKQDEIIHQSNPKEILMLERLEYGRAIAFPKELQLADGSRLSVESPAFYPTLHRLVEESNQRWDKIRDLEKNQIGKINHKMESINLDLKETSTPAKTAALQEEKTELETKYQKLADQAQQLRSLQTENQLVYQLSEGAKKTLPVSQIIHFYFPNQLSLTGRLGLFFRNLGVFLSEEPREANTEGGVFPAIFGTLVMTVLMSLAVVPLGIMAAVYLSEYAKQGIWVRWVRIAVNNLAGVPSIVFGVFGLGFFVYMVGGSIDSLFFSNKLPTPTFGTGGLFWASLTLAMMTVPVVIVATEEALSSVGRGTREGALACGASKWQMVKRVLLPASAPGILTGAILAMARGAGEVAPLMLVGVVKLAPTLPINGTFPYVHLDQKFMHLGFHIFDLGFQSPDSEAAIPMVFATTLLLIALVLVLNLGAILLRERLRKRYAAASF